MSSDNNTHWCYQCLQPVQLRTPNPVCSFCSGGFVQELNEMVINGRQNFDPFHEHNVFNHRSINPMENFALIRQRNSGLTRSSLVFENGIVEWESRMSSTANDDEFEFFNGGPLSSRPSNSNNNVFMGTSFQEMVEQMIAGNNGQQGPRAASRSAIDSLPTIKITNGHLNNDPNCPVCQDKFDLGSEVKMMPCDHIYHSGCIVPWLLEHNSCPVCRLELPTNDGGRNQGRWNPASLWWSFHS